MAAHVGAGHPQAEVSLDVIDIYRAQAQRILTIAELFGDAKHIAGFQTMEWLKGFYGGAKGLQAAGVAGADALVNYLAPLFAKSEAESSNTGPV